MGVRSDSMRMEIEFLDKFLYGNIDFNIGHRINE